LGDVALDAAVDLGGQGFAQSLWDLQADARASRLLRLLLRLFLDRGAACAGQAAFGGGLDVRGFTGRSRLDRFTLSRPSQLRSRGK